MISILLPTRQRAPELHRLVTSINDTATDPDRVELVTYIDEDDPSYDDLSLDITWVQVRGPRVHADGLVNLSVKWNDCYDACAGDILMHCGDDIVMRTRNWDGIVRDAFHADEILFAYGRDGLQDGTGLGTHGFISRTWVETVGYLFPPLFVSDYNDSFLNDVAKAIGRHREIPIYTEHMHYLAGKARIDQNTSERIARHSLHDPAGLYASARVQNMIAEAAAKLRTVMA